MKCRRTQCWASIWLPRLVIFLTTRLVDLLIVCHADLKHVWNTLMRFQSHLESSWIIQKYPESIWKRNSWPRTQSNCRNVTCKGISYLIAVSCTDSQYTAFIHLGTGSSFFAFEEGGRYGRTPVFCRQLNIWYETTRVELLPQCRQNTTSSNAPPSELAGACVPKTSVADHALFSISVCHADVAHLQLCTSARLRKLCISMSRSGGLAWLREEVKEFAVTRH